MAGVGRRLVGPVEVRRVDRQAALHAPASEVAGEHTARMTLTPHALLQCEHLFLLITGRDKRMAYEIARVTKDQAALPVSIFLQQSAVPLTVFWSP